ncbi:MAG: hypothetical protein EAX86_10265 [Candidatus Heimdallarchaeota archaeon]|nr:hypothetical protein [Candidatus Heimdallarchaeota archaeon]
MIILENLIKPVRSILYSIEWILFRIDLKSFGIWPFGFLWYETECTMLKGLLGRKRSFSSQILLENLI